MHADSPVLWTPPAELLDNSALTMFARWLATERGLSFSGYDELWRWSTDDLEGFWASVWAFFDVPSTSPAASVLPSREMPGARWFEGASLNYADVALRESVALGRTVSAQGDPAIVAFDEDGTTREIGRVALIEAVGAAAAGLRRLGVGVGDRVAALLPTGPESVIAFLATASIGAIWSSCSPDFGVRAVIDRFGQIEPKVLIAVAGYRYGGRWFDRQAELDEIAASLPGVSCVVVGAHHAAGAAPDAGTTTWDRLVSIPSPLRCEPVPFEHPLWVVFSSGTTGMPKAMVQGHGGIVLEHLKSLSLHLDLGPGDRFFWFTTTGWMMWNFLVGGLLVGATIVLYDGSPAHPDMSAIWRLAERARITYLGTSAPFLHASMRTSIEPQKEADLSSLRAIGSTGAPLSFDGAEWVADRLGPQVWLGSISGGTDLCTAVVTSCPWLPVRAGELQCRALGARVEAFDDDGRGVIDQVGELVITAPMPSMPVSFWGDPVGSRYRESYFETYPGVWRHGDWITIRSTGSCVISGRSDATLNRGGVRSGTSDFYRVVEAIAGVAASLVIDTGSLDREGELVLFVALDAGELDDRLRATIEGRLRSELSPRHVPDRIVEAPGVPTTLNGKRLEVPVKRMLMGEPPAGVASRDSLADPAVFDWFVAYAARHATGD